MTTELSDEDAARLAQDRDAKLAALDAAIARGVASADAGRVHDLDEVAASLIDRYITMSRNGRG